MGLFLSPQTRRTARGFPLSRQAKLAQDDDARFAAVVEQYGRLLRDAIARVCPRHLGLQFDDLEQEARVRLWKALRSEREVRDLASYIYKVAATTTIDAIRRLKARREQQLEPEDPEATERAQPARDAGDGDLLREFTSQAAVNVDLR